MLLLFAPQVIALRAVETTDFMTADWYDIPPPVMRKISSRITNEVQGVNRVVYDVSSKREWSHFVQLLRFAAVLTDDIGYSSCHHRDVVRSVAMVHNHNVLP